MLKWPKERELVQMSLKHLLQFTQDESSLSLCEHSEVEKKTYFLRPPHLDPNFYILKKK